MTLYISWNVCYQNSQSDELIDMHELSGVLFKTKFNNLDLRALSFENCAAYSNPQTFMRVD